MSSQLKKLARGNWPLIIQFAGSVESSMLPALFLVCMQEWVVGNRRGVKEIRRIGALGEVVAVDAIAASAAGN